MLEKLCSFPSICLMCYWCVAVVMINYFSYLDYVDIFVSYDVVRLGWLFKWLSFFWYILYIVMFDTIYLFVVLLEGSCFCIWLFWIFPCCTWFLCVWFVLAGFFWQIKIFCYKVGSFYCVCCVLCAFGRHLLLWSIIFIYHIFCQLFCF